MKKTIVIAIIITLINLCHELKADGAVYTVHNCTNKSLTVTMTKKNREKEIVKQDSFSVDAQQQKSRTIDERTPIMITVRFQDGTPALKGVDFIVRKDNALS